MVSKSERDDTLMKQMDIYCILNELQLYKTQKLSLLLLFLFLFFFVKLHFIKLKTKCLN